MKILCCLSVLILGLGTLHAKFPDGIWNGKPWTKADLEKEAAKGNPDALAEWAFCSIYTYQNIAFDPELAMKRAMLAAAKGSGLGEYSVYCILKEGYGHPKNKQKAMSYLKKSFTRGHPVAIWRVGVLTRVGISGYKKDTKKSILLLKKSSDLGCWLPQLSQSTILMNGETGVIDIEASAKFLNEVVDRHDSFFGAIDVFRAIQNPTQKNVGLRKHLSQEVIQKATRRVNASADMGQPRALFIRSYMGILHGNAHEAVPEFIKSGNMGETSVAWNLAAWLRNRHHLRTPHILGENVESAWKAAGIAYKNGHREPILACRYVEGALSNIHEKIPANEAECIAMMLDIIKSHPKHAYRAHSILGIHFRGKYDNHACKNEVYKRGIAHYLQVVNRPYNAHFLTWYFIYGKKNKDMAKGVVAAEWAMKINGGSWLKYEKIWYAHALKKLTPAQKKECDQLRAEGYPNAKKYKLEAFKYLQSIGDIPKDREFEKKRVEEELEDASLRRKQGTLCWLILTRPSLLFLTIEDSNISLQTVLQKLLKQEPLNKDEQKALVHSLMQQSPELSEWAGKQNSKALQERAINLQKTLTNKAEDDKGLNRLGARIGWYLIYEGDQLTSIPYVFSVKDGGPAHKGGIRAGDVIDTFNGASLKSKHSRNRFMNLLKVWPDNTPVTVEIRHNKFQRTSNGAGRKSVKKTFKVTLENQG